jgi:membrane-bound lytic murein transglycosylase D
MEEPLSMTLPSSNRSDRAGPIFLPALIFSLLLGACATLPPPSSAPPNPSVQASAQALVKPEALLAAAPPAAGAAAAAASAPAPSPVNPVDEIAAPVDPLRPGRPVDIDPEAAQVDLWDRVRRGFALPDLDNEQVRAREQYYATRPDYVARMTERGSRYLFHIVEAVERRGMPTEIALLPFIESAFNPQANSVAAAAGMWQFIPSTGRDFDLKQNVFRDDRRDVLASTSAALDYLERLHNQFGDWHLALAAYNWGEGSVQRAMMRNEKLGLPTDYWSLRMPAETRDYVPKLQAMKNIVAKPQDFAIELPELKNHPYFLSVPIERDIDVEVAARLAGVSMEEFRLLNPQMNKPVILAAGTPQVLLPYDNANDFVHQLNSHHGPLASWTAWVAPRTMRPGDAAKLTGMAEARLREVNRIPPRMLIKTGSTLLVPRGARVEDDVSEHVADNAVIALAPDVPPLKRVSFRAGKRGDSVASVARRYRVSSLQVARWNKVTTAAKFKPGTTIVVYVPQRTKLALVAPPDSGSSLAHSRARAAR